MPGKLHPNGRVSVPKTLSNPHRIIQAWLEDDRRQQETARQIPYGPYSPTYSSRHYTETERRRLRILSALFNALEKRRHEVIADAQNIHDVVLSIAGERVDFTVTQRQRQFQEELTAEESRNPYNIARGAKWKVVQRPTDELVFRIRSWVSSHVRTEWGDAPALPLEEQLNSVVVGLLVAAADIRQQGLEREETQRRMRAEQMERLRQEEAQRREAWRIGELLGRIEQWRRAADIRAYVEAVCSAAKSGLRPSNPARLEEWATWALAVADRVDPIVSGKLTATDMNESR